MKNKGLFFGIGILLLIILISGCTDGDKVGRTSDFPGLAITQFISDYPEIDSGEQMFVEVDFENTGDSTARDIQGKLIRKGAFLVEPTGMQSNVPDLDPPITEVPSKNAFLWEITAPQVTQDRVEELQARVFYKYSSEAFATINFVPRDILKERGEGEFQIDSASSYGPIEIDIVAKQPVVIRPGDTNEKTVSITVTLENVWDGRVESGEGITSTEKLGECIKPLDCIDELKIEGFGPTCVDASTGLPLEKTFAGVRLIDGIDGKITEDFTLKISDANAATSCQIKATANYRYRVDSEILSLAIRAID